ncbi:MAG TPA: DUF4446 family protein [bacterium]|nr:DUF4446 family protein [bacterium]
MFTALNDVQAWLIVIIALAALGVLVALVTLVRALRSRGTQPGGPLTAEESLRREVSAINARLTILEESIGRVADALPRTVQGVGIVRYNPFAEMGSNMSFSLALLDGRANGVVVSVLTGRDGSRVYGKAVEAGASSYPLSEEERQALALARGGTRA